MCNIINNLNIIPHTSSYINSSFINMLFFSFCTLSKISSKTSSLLTSIDCTHYQRLSRPKKKNPQSYLVRTFEGISTSANTKGYRWLVNIYQPTRRKRSHLPCPIHPKGTIYLWGIGLQRNNNDSTRTLCSRASVQYGKPDYHSGRFVDHLHTWILKGYYIHAKMSWS